MTFKFTITGETPSKKNSKRWAQRGSRRVLLPSENHEAWHQDAGYQLKRQARPSSPIALASVAVDLYPGTARKGDLTNKAESIMDLLVDVGVLEDDNWHAVPKLTLRMRSIDRGNPRAEITVTPQ